MVKSVEHPIIDLPVWPWKTRDKFEIGCGGYPRAIICY